MLCPLLYVLSFFILFQGPHPRNQIIGHRGIRGLAPENTLVSFREAIRQGSDGIESDVRLTKDHIIALLHDNDLSLMTTGKGLVSETNWYGGIEDLRTKQRPHLPIPIFADAIDLREAFFVPLSQSDLL